MLQSAFNEVKAPYSLLFLTFWAVSIDNDRQELIERRRLREKAKRQQVYFATVKPSRLVAAPAR